MVLVFLVVLGVAGTVPAEAQLTWKLNDFEVTLSGQFVAELALTSDPLQPAEGFSLYADPRPPLQRRRGLISGRQTGLNLTITAPALGSFNVRGVVDFNLQGSDPGAGSPGAFFQAAFVELRNNKWRFAFGRFGSLVTPLAATTINWAGIENGGDLNSGTPRDQFQVERYFEGGENWSFSLQGGISNPESNFLIAEPDRVSEDAGIPNFEGRVAAGLGPENPDGTRRFEVGFSGAGGKLRAEDPARRIEDDVWLAGLDFAYRGERFGFVWELWTGKGIGSYGGGIGQTAAGDSLLRAAGSFVQASYRMTDKWEARLAFGRDDPHNEQLDPGMRSRNDVFIGTLMFQPVPPLELGYELRHYSTFYTLPSLDNKVFANVFMSRYRF